MKSQHATTFAVDGRLYSFTTLRPEPPPNGALRLVAWNARTLNLLVFASMGLVGVIFVRRSASSKLIVLATILIGLVVVGVFAPTLAMQLLDGYLLLAVILVLVAWVVSGVLRRGVLLAATRDAQLATSVLSVPGSVASEPESPFQEVNESAEQDNSKPEEGEANDE